MSSIYLQLSTNIYKSYLYTVSSKKQLAFDFNVVNYIIRSGTGAERIVRSAIAFYFAFLVRMALHVPSAKKNMHHAQQPGSRWRRPLETQHLLQYLFLTVQKKSQVGLQAWAVSKTNSIEICHHLLSEGALAHLLRISCTAFKFHLSTFFGRKEIFKLSSTCWDLTSRAWNLRNESQVCRIQLFISKEFGDL